MDIKPFAITVIVVTHNRPNLLSRALNTMAKSLDQIDYKVDIRLLVNGTDPDSIKLCEEFKKNRPQLPFEIKCITTEITPAEGRNLLVERVASPWLFFMDDDVQIPIDLFKNFEKLCQEFPEIETWGGPNLTPTESDHEAHRNGWFVENFFIVGPVSKRYRKYGSGQLPGGQFNLMLCNLFVKSQLFIEEKFSPQLKTAEENDLIYRIQKRKRKLGFSDTLFVWHERRPTLKAFFKQIFYYGFGRGQLLVSGRLLPQWQFVLYPAFLTAGICSTFLFPLQASLVIGIWLLSVKASYIKKFHRFDGKIILIPVAVLFLYLFGLIKGVWQGLTTANNESLISEKIL